ncbi:mannose-6-phosphate isomerase class I [Chitinophaga niastensis]|uniref:Mannose-6-phosphate isomerase class I n=1 Tax=Chitinophaga niastensis TaxID=536980 RepID=A0A2P8HHI6_CHINA|nr:class I mannose-6-phosphate isomerase [Chitinophaga niastensis]PSL45661.1 mannose-6-phosphate isomerase class I [Chitinophaga niastensis]
MKIQELALNVADHQNVVWRNSSQSLLPAQIAATEENGYNIYPLHPIGQGKIHTGYPTLARWIATQALVLIDGYVGICWDEVQEALEQEFYKQGLKVKWHFTKALQKDTSSIQQLVTPFIGNEGDVWGKKCTLDITAFFQTGQLSSLAFDPAYDINIVIGTGAALTHPDAPVVYLDIPKNELQYRMRAGAVTNFGSKPGDAAAEIYKRFYFVDWVVLNEYKQTLLNRIVIMADTQWRKTIAWIFNTDLLEGIDKISQSTFRVRPWFEAGAWGGQWMKEHISALNKEEINYAWSFEMIVPENGILFESDGNLLEIPFEWMMFYRHNNILGRHAAIFRYEFPIRFDFLDTFDGGNLSIQCHPFLSYIREHFGETITQDETYYILDCKEDAAVYLGFQEGIDAGAFRDQLENSRDHGIPVNIEQYVQRHSAGKHDLFLIPNGTVHSAGSNNLVLEISATPYIFTFKMYDWLRPGLDGKPRSISIEHAFNNLDFSRQGAAVTSQLLSVPTIIEQGTDWQIIHLPTHAAHFYDIHRLEFDNEIIVHTNNNCLVLMLVEGTAVSVITASGETIIYHYAETFVIPAAARECRIKNMGSKRAKVIKAFLKDEHYIFTNITSI